VGVELDVLLFAMLPPHPLTATVIPTQNRIARRIGQRRRRNPGAPSNTNEASATPAVRAKVMAPRIPVAVPEFFGLIAARWLPVVVQALSVVFTVTEPFVTVPLLLTLGFVKEKQALVSELGAETLRETAPVKPPAGVRVTVDAPLLPWATVTFVADRVNDWLAVEEETLSVSVPDDAALVALFDGA
jgi:hypothetical protein